MYAGPSTQPSMPLRAHGAVSENVMMMRGQRALPFGALALLHRSVKVVCALSA